MAPTISAPVIRLQHWMKNAASPEPMALEQDRRISDTRRLAFRG